jgi:type 1 fimbria pilin
MVRKRIAAYFITVSVISLFAGKSMGETFTPQWGKVSLQGIINECACSITSGNAEQSVDLNAFVGQPHSSHRRTAIFSIFFTSCIPVPASAHGEDINKRFRAAFSNHISDVQDTNVDSSMGLQILDANRKPTSSGEAVMIKNNQLKNQMQVLYYIQAEYEKGKTVNRQINSSVRFNVDYY